MLFLSVLTNGYILQKLAICRFNSVGFHKLSEIYLDKNLNLHAFHFHRVQIRLRLQYEKDLMYS